MCLLVSFFSLHRWQAAHYSAAFSSIAGCSMKSAAVNSTVQRLAVNLQRDDKNLSFSISEIAETFSACSQIYPISEQDKMILQKINNILISHSIQTLT